MSNAPKSTERGVAAAAISFPQGTGQRIGTRLEQETKYRRLISGLKPDEKTTVNLYFPRGSNETNATGFWTSGPVEMGAGPLCEFMVKCKRSPPRLFFSLLDVTIEVINGGQSTSTNETVEIEVVLATGR